MIRLVAKLGGKTVATGEFDGVPHLRIGAASESDLVLEGLACSDDRLVILYRDGVYQLRDLGDGDVVTVNGKPISTHNLNDQDVIEIGAHQVSVVLGSADPVESPVTLEADPNPTRALERGKLELALARRSKKPHLVRHRKGGEEDVIPIDDHGVSVGSGKDCGIVLRGWTRIPRRLALIVRGCGGYSLLNFSSKLGAVKLNHAAVGVRSWLNDGDVLELGQTTLTFYEEIR